MGRHRVLGQLMLALSALLAAATFTVADFGAIPDDGLDDAQAFRDTWAAACVPHVGQNTIRPGGGTFDLQKIDNQSAVYIVDCAGVDFIGEGEGVTITRHFGGTHVGDYHQFHVRDSSNISFSNWTCDGNRSAILDADQQTHCLNTEDVVDFSLHDATLSHLWGDGIRVLGSLATNARIAITDVTMDDNGRSGIAIATGTDISITRFTASNIDQSCIDTEPGSGIGLDGLTITDVTCTRPRRWAYGETISLSGATGELCNPDPASATHCAALDITLTNVKVLGGCMGGINADRVTLTNVTVDCPNGPAFVMGRDYQHVTITNSAFAAEGANAAIHLSADNDIDHVHLEHVKLTAQHGTAFDVEGGAGNIMLVDVRIRSQGPFARGAGVNITTLGATPEIAAVSIDLDLVGLATGVGLAPRQGLAGITSATIAGTIVTRPGVGTVGVLCENGGATTTTVTASITAATQTSGCP